METIEIRGVPQPASRIGLGTWAMGGWMWGGTDDAAAVAAIRRAHELGVTLIDTAPVYGFGHAEEVVGRAIAPIRDDLVIATKCGLTWDDAGRVTRDASPARIRREVHDSLRRLGTDRIDVYQVHWPDAAVPFDDTARALDDLRREGTILAIGVSNFAPDQMDALQAISPLATVQPPYNLFERGVEADVLPYAARHELVVLAYGALCRGLLSGRMGADTTFQGDDLRQADPKFRPPRYEQYLRAVDALAALARERHATSVLALAVRWVLDAAPAVALWGARRPDQLEAIGDVTGWRLSGADMAEIDAILDRTITDPVGPEFMAPPVREHA